MLLACAGHRTTGYVIEIYKRRNTGIKAWCSGRLGSVNGEGRCVGAVVF